MVFNPQLHKPQIDQLLWQDGPIVNPRGAISGPAEELVLGMSLHLPESGTRDSVSVQVPLHAGPLLSSLWKRIVSFVRSAAPGKQ